MTDPNLKAPIQVPTQPRPDPLASLYKMSTTAGLLSREYVAVNSTAVVAMLLGVASGLALFASILLVIPIAGIVVSIVAFRQVKNSNGTETGKGLSIGGLILSTLFAGGVLTMHGLEAARVRDDAQQLSQVVKKLGEAVVSDHLSDAYDMFDNQFKGRVPQRTFEDVWRNLSRGDYLSGRLQGLYWNNVPPAYETLSNAVDVYMDVVADYERSKDQRLRIVFQKSGTRWYIHDIPGQFPIPRPGKG